MHKILPVFSIVVRKKYILKIDKQTEHFRVILLIEYEVVIRCRRKH